MLLIFAATKGEITPNDFYDIVFTFAIAGEEGSQIRFEGVMKLEQWLKLNGITIVEFAARLGVSRTQVHKYIYEGAIPKYKTMRLIFELTGGAVTPNIFYNIVPIFTAASKVKSQVEFMEAAND